MNRYYLCIIDRKTVICKEEDTASCITKKGLLHKVGKLRATALVHYVSDIATSAPSTAYAVPLPRCDGGG